MRAGMNDGKEFFIRNGANYRSEADFKSGNDYFYFNENFDIIMKAYEYYVNSKYILKKYIGMIIARYKGEDFARTYTMGRFYITAQTKTSYREITRK